MAVISKQYDFDPMIGKAPPATPVDDTGPAVVDPDVGMVPPAQSQTPATSTPVSGTQTMAPGANPPATSPRAGETDPAPTPTPTPTPTTPTPASTTAQPVTRTVNAGTETVAGQLNSLLSEDSPLLQQARARAMGQMNARGLVNSSIANSAALDAVLQSALPVASADAGVYGTAARDNQDVQNQFAGRQQLAEIERVADERRQTFQQSNMQLASQLDTDSRERLMAIEQNYRQITNGSNQASQLLQDMQSRIGVILANTEIPIENKQGLIDQMIESTMRSATLIGAINGLDFSDLFGGTDG